MTEEQKNAIGLIDVESLPDSEGIIRYDIPTLMSLCSLNAVTPTIAEACCVISPERFQQYKHEHDLEISDKESVPEVITEFPTEVASSARVDPRVRALRNILNQFTLENPEMICDMLYNNLEEYIDEAPVLKLAIESIIDKCCQDHLYCDAFVALLKMVIGKMTEKSSLVFLSALLDCSQEIYKQPAPSAELKGEERTLYERNREGFFHFLGALFVNSLICEDIILSVMIALSQGYPTSQLDIVCLLQIIRTIGSCMEHDTENKLTIDEIFRTMHTWQMEKLLPSELIDTIRELRDLKDAKWVITMEVNKMDDSAPTGDWEKIPVGRRVRNRKEVGEEQAESIRAANELALYCKNLWNDYVRYFVVDDIADEVLKFDDAQRASFIGSSFKSLLFHSELQQRRVSVLLQAMLSRGDISREVFMKGMEEAIAEYIKRRKTSKQALPAFRNMYLPLLMEGDFTIRSLVELWKNKEYFDGALAELVFNLMNCWKAIDKDAATKALEEAKLTTEEVFVGGCPMIIMDRILQRNHFTVKDGVLCFVWSVCGKMVGLGRGAWKLDSRGDGNVRTVDRIHAQ